MLNHERIRLILDVISTTALVVAASALILMRVNGQPQTASAVSNGNANAVESVDLRVAAKGHVKGAKTAQLAIIEFSDFQCPFCAQFAKDTLPQLERDFITPGVVQLIFRHYPLESIHPFATRASAAAECAGQQNKYWEMHDALFSQQRELGEQLWATQARELRLDIEAFTTCLETEAATVQIKIDQQEAARLGVTFTPIFLIGRIESDGNIKIMRRINGAVPYDVFKATIRELL